MSASAKRETKTKEEFPDVGEFHRDAVGVLPVDVDWSELGRDGGFDFWEAATCDECGAVVVGSGGTECRKGHEVLLEGPMMNYYYPMDEDCLGDPEEAARKVADLPLCVVRVGVQYGLALTGGGMNLAWEICEAFMRLDHVPPLHFADLPSMAGRGSSARDQWIIRGCKDACDTATVRSAGVRKHLEDLAVAGPGPDAALAGRVVRAADRRV